MLYQRNLLKELDFYYMKVFLEFGDAHCCHLNAHEFKQHIHDSMQELFGDIGKAIPIDILKYKENRNEAILRVRRSGFVQLWSSLTLCGAYRGHDCAFRVIQISGHLMALAANSRTAVFKAGVAPGQVP